MKLIRKPIKQQEWFKQYLESKHDFIRTTDRLSIAEIYDLYNRKMKICDTCGKEIPLTEWDFTVEGLRTHIIHMINKNILTSCEDCTNRDFSDGRVIPKIMGKLDKT